MTSRRAPRQYARAARRSSSSVKGANVMRRPGVARATNPVIHVTSRHWTPPEEASAMASVLRRGVRQPIWPLGWCCTTLPHRRREKLSLSALRSFLGGG